MDKTNEPPFANIIYTYEGMPQQFVDIKITQDVLNNKELFFMRITGQLDDKEKKLLYKISCCVYWAEKINWSLCEWYSNQNGKFYSDEIPYLMKKLYDIECTYESLHTPKK